MLVFTDESEWPKPSDPSGYTLWAAVALEPQQSKTFSREVFLLKKKFWDVQEPYELEIKGRLLLNRRALTSPKKVEFVEEIVSLCKLHRVQVFAVGLRSSQATFPGLTEKHEYRMYLYLLERVEAMMQEKQTQDMAVVIFDTRGEGTDAARATAFGNFIYGHQVGMTFQKIVDTPLFVASKLSVGIQVADLFAYALAQRNLGRKEEPLRRACDRIRELEWRSDRADIEYPLRGFRFVDLTRQ